MADEHQFIRDGLQRSQIDEFFAEELGRAGYGGMEMAPTPMGMQIVLKAEKPGMVIGKGGKNIRKVTTQLEERFDLEDPQIDVQEVDEPDLNARIVADRLANALERGWYFRKAGHTTLERIMDAGALGAEIVLSGKVTGARSRVEKFNDGYIKHNGEPAEEVVDHGQGVAVMKLGTIGVDVKIIPPGAELPDDFKIHDDADVAEVAPEAVEENKAAAAVIDEPSDEELAEIREDAQADADEAAEADDSADAEGAVDEDVVEEVIEEEVVDDDEDLDEDVDVPTDDDVDEDLEELDEAVEAEAEAMLDEMDEEDATDESADEAAGTDADDDEADTEE